PGPPCATDPVYEFIESIQKADYEEDPVALELLKKHQHTAADRLQAEFARSNQRPDATHSATILDSDVQKGMLADVASTKVPTCYEDPLVFYAIKGNVDVIDRARKELGYPLSYQPKYGSAPTESVNALTF